MKRAFTTQLIAHPTHDHRCLECRNMRACRNPDCILGVFSQVGEPWSWCRECQPTGGTPSYQSPVPHEPRQLASGMPRRLWGLIDPAICEADGNPHRGYLIAPGRWGCRGCGWLWNAIGQR